MVLNKSRTYRFNDETLKKIEEIRKREPENYPTDSSVIRAGVFFIYNQKFRGTTKK